MVVGVLGAEIGVGDVLTRWRLDPGALLVTILFAALYGRAVRRFDAAHPDRRWPTRRRVAAAAAVGGMVVATQSGIGRYDTERLTIHMIQHLLLGMAVPFAIVLSAPMTLALQAGSPGARHLVRRALALPVTRVLTHPVVTWLLFGGGMVAVYLTPLLGWSARHPVVHVLVHQHLLLSGCLFLVGLVGVDRLPNPLPYGARLLAVLLAVPFHAILGLAMLSARQPLAPDAYPSLSDQRTAAALLWIMGELFTVSVAAVVVARWYRADQREAARIDRRLDAARAEASRVNGG